MFGPHQIFCAARSQIEYLCNIYNKTIFIEFQTRYLPPAYPSQMADQYGVTPEDYVDGLKILSNTRYGEGMLFLIPSSPKQWLKPL